jgi:hypothetical protein
MCENKVLDTVIDREGGRGTGDRGGEGRGLGKQRGREQG